MPNGLVFPLALGMSTLRTGSGSKVLAMSCWRVPQRLPSKVPIKVTHGFSVYPSRFSSLVGVDGAMAARSQTALQSRLWTPVVVL